MIRIEAQNHEMSLLFLNSHTFPENKDCKWLFVVQKDSQKVNGDERKNERLMFCFHML